MAEVKSTEMIDAVIASLRHRDNAPTGEVIDMLLDIRNLCLADERARAGAMQVAVDQCRRAGVLARALQTLDKWDMLSLDAEGNGVAVADAPWARAIIRNALRIFEEMQKGGES